MRSNARRVDRIDVQWTPAEVLSIQAAALREMEADPAAPYVPGIERDCAMAKCDHAAEGPPLVVNVATIAEEAS